MPDTALPYQIFIVYAREDREPLEALRRKLVVAALSFELFEQAVLG